MTATCFVDYMMGRHPGRHAMSRLFLNPLTKAESIAITDAVERMRPQIEAAKPAVPLSNPAGSVGGGPSRPEDYTLTASNIKLVERGLLLVMGLQEGSLAEFAEASELRRKFRHGFETIIRDMQP